MLSYQQVTTPATSAQTETEIISRLAELGFASKGWQSGSIQLTFVKIMAWMYSRFTVFAATFAASVLNDTAADESLTRFSASHYDNTRTAAVAAQYNARFTVAAGEGPHTFAAGDVIISNGRYQYRNVAGATITDAAPSDLTVEAEIVGSAPNTADSTITTLVTPLAGVTVTNPPPSQVRAGADEEQDDVLRRRNTTKWAQLSIEMPGDGYVNLALEVAGVERVKVDATNPSGPGTFDVYIASANGLAGGVELAAVQDIIDARRSVSSIGTAKHTPVYPLTVSGVVYYRASTPGAAAAIDPTVEDYLETLPIGGELFTDVLTGLTPDGIISVIRGIDGVVNVDLLTPATDLVLPDFAIVQVTVTISKVPI